MKYAVINQRGGVNRITDTEPFVGENTIVVEISEEDAALVISGRQAYPKIHYRWVEGQIMTLKDAIAREKFLAMPLEEARSTKVAELENARYEAEIAGITLPDGREIRTDKETQGELGKALGIIGTINPDLEIDWKFPSGEVVHMDATQIQQIAGAVFAHVQATRTAFKEKATFVAAATTQEELDAITW